jgi:hypothetical protein
VSNKTIIVKIRNVNVVKDFHHLLCLKIEKEYGVIYVEAINVTHKMCTCGNIRSFTNPGEKYAQNVNLKVLFMFIVKDVNVKGQ